MRPIASQAAPPHLRDGLKLRFLIRTAVATFAAMAMASPAMAGDLEDAAAAIDAWQIGEARSLLEKIEKSGELTGEYYHQRGRLAFFQGDYDEALALLDQALVVGPDDIGRGYARTRHLTEAARDATKDFVEVVSPNGYIKLRVEKGKDEVLVPYALETLDAAYVHIGNDLGYKPPAPVLVEIYPKPEVLAAVSGLTEDEIKTSGTIALCSYNRLMFTSPKALLRGYPWRDTLSHEFVHLVVTQKTRNNVPIWMHEGIAKFQERRWRGDGPDVRRIEPHSENALRKGLEKDELVTFEEMHPSMAKLPSQETTTLAFAEVYTVMEYIHQQKGIEGIASMLDVVRDTRSPEKGIEKTMGVSFAAFQKNWLAWLKRRDTKGYDEDFVFTGRLAFKGDKEPSELLEIGKKEARDHIHLGELLQARDRYHAAVVQYRKARRLIGARNPILVTRLARSLLLLRRFDEAAETVEQSLTYYPSFHTIRVLYGEALVGLKRYRDAEPHLIEAVGINPFDPRPHELLAEVYAQTDRSDLAERSRNFAAMVR